MNHYVWYAKFLKLNNVFWKMNCYVSFGVLKPHLLIISLTVRVRGSYMSLWKEETHGFNFFVIQRRFVESILLISLSSETTLISQLLMFHLQRIGQKSVLAHCLLSFSFLFPVGTETQTRKKPQNENCGVCRKSCWSWWQRCKLDLQEV